MPRNKKKKRKGVPGSDGARPDDRRNTDVRDDSNEKKDKLPTSLSESELVADGRGKSELDVAENIENLGIDLARDLHGETDALKQKLKDQGGKISKHVEEKRKMEEKKLEIRASEWKDDIQKTAKRGGPHVSINSNIAQVGDFNKVTMKSREGGQTSTYKEEDWPSLPLRSSVDRGARPKKLPNRGSWEGDPIVKIHADVVQVGDGHNVVHNNRSSCKIAGNLSEQTTVNLVVQHQPTQPRPNQTKEIENLRKYFGNVSTGHFILLADEVEFVPNIDALGLIRWTVVIDFDPKSWQTGLLSRLRNNIENNAWLDYISWQDVRQSITHESVTWIGIMGISSQPDTVVDSNFKSWKREVMKPFHLRINLIKQFSEQYTDLKVLVLWPDDSGKVKHFKEVIDKLCGEIDDLEVCVVVQEKKRPSQDEVSILSLLQTDEQVTITKLEIDDVCNVLQSICISRNKISEKGYQLPTSEGTDIPKISERDANWLQVDVDVLYFDNKTETEYTSEELLQEEHNFYKGGTLPWSAWYALPMGTFVIERDVKRSLVQFIMTRHFKSCRSGIIHLFHNPGSGGTTLAQSVVWELRREMPCVQIKHRFGSLVQDVIEKLKFVHERTHLPVLVLIDGEEKQRVESLFRFLRDHVCVIMLNVQRFFSKLSDDDDNNRDTFWLKSFASKKEALQLQYQYLRQCKEKAQKNRLMELTQKIQRNEEHSIFEFGLAVHSYNYSGISSYVSSYLQIEQSQKSLHSWQKALCYLSLVYFFGQTSLPCFFFSGLIEKDQITRQKSDFPEQMQEFIVKDEHEKRPNMVRISHYFVAKEILNQLLPFPKKTATLLSPALTEDARKKLGKFAVEFITIAGRKNNDQYSNIAHIMTKTFISRNNKVGSESDTLGKQQTKPRVSPILEQASYRAPYTERFDILRQLTISFPAEAQFMAHLGRLYSICRPNEQEKAEKHVIEALTMSEGAIGDKSEEEIPHTHKLELMHIYHMYGNILLHKVGKKTGKFYGETPSCHSFETEADSLVSEVNRACVFFNKCRQITPLGCEKTFGYVEEIQIRLMFCSFVQENSGYRTLHNFIAKNESAASVFVQDSCVELDELFVECYSVIDPETMDGAIGICQEWYSLLFQNMPGYVLPDSSDGVKTRKLKIARIKMKYCTKEKYGMLESINNKKDIQAIAKYLEKNLEEYDQQEKQSVSKRQMDLDYKEWIYIIRHHLFEQNYPIEQVLKVVEVWNEKVKSPMSRFYQFVLKSVLGFGHAYAQGNVQLLLEAKCLKEDVLKLSKLVTKPKYPREWLGLPQDSIRHLFPGLRFFGQIQNREIPGNDLESRKGAIVVPNDKPSSGYIDLDLGPYNKCSIKAFFIPARADSPNGMVGTKHSGDRVEFVLGFSLLHGYEAFNVRPLETVTCRTCKICVEKTRDENNPTCPKCRVVVESQHV